MTKSPRKWIDNSNPPENLTVEVEIQHDNPKLKLKNQRVIGYMGDDNFYLTDGSELSFSWTIVRWRRLSSPNRS